MSDSQDEKLEKCAGWLREADGLLVTAGAGMGVDSGLPDFRGRDGFWRAYPALRHHGLSFEDMANPARFAEHQELAWGFYGHRLQLYRDTVPHEGFAILRRWADRMSHGGFVFTSNVDGQFQKAGFSEDRIRECHGSIHTLQCLNVCTTDTWAAKGFNPLVNENTSALECPMPRCPRCGAVGPSDQESRIGLVSWSFGLPLDADACRQRIQSFAICGVPATKTDLERMHNSDNNRKLVRTGRDGGGRPCCTQSRFCAVDDVRYICVKHGAFR